MKLVPVGDAQYLCEYVNALFDAMEQPKRRFITHMINCLNDLGKHGDHSERWFEAKLSDLDTAAAHRSIRISAHRVIELTLHDEDRADELQFHLTLCERLLASATTLHALAEQAETDQLTGLLRREAWPSVIKALSGSGCLIYIDLDQFKSVNDHQGHVAGDALLHRFGRHLKGHFRDSDSLFRWGGDEFVLILPAITLEHATQKMQTLQDTTATWVPFSFGVERFDSHMCLTTALERADQSLYQHKERS